MYSGLKKRKEMDDRQMSKYYYILQCYNTVHTYIYSIFN